MLDRVGYQVLKRICPTGDTGYMTGEAYAGKSKLATLFGPDVFTRMYGKTVIDFGCGTGAEAIEMAKHGARLVIGVDIREKFLREARVAAEAAGVSDRCLFGPTPPEAADVIVSLDSFEHFDDPAAILEIMAGYLQPDGEVLVSFGPPWYHPLGGHMFSVFPWAHLAFPEASLLRWRKDLRPQQTAKTILECGVNKMTVRRFERLVQDSPLRFAEFEARPINRARLFANALTREFLTSSVRCRLVRKASPVVERRG